MTSLQKKRWWSVRQPYHGGGAFDREGAQDVPCELEQGSDEDADKVSVPVALARTQQIISENRYWDLKKNYAGDREAE